ncbi:MAG TPA: hypothetical protein VHG51_03200 [Longimicrobiaceae bacterium]|nr:hypothetical protein [Longimicrobiaceae bacterium]
MIPVTLRDWAPRLLLLALVVWALYLLEPGFHQHEAVEAGQLPVEELGPLGISATLSYLAGLATIVLLAGFVSTDRRRGYALLYLSHPVRPLALYGLRWALAAAAALLAALLFLVFGQLLAWGGFRGGWPGLLLPALSVLVYGGLMATLSAALPRGDAWVALALFLPTFFPQLLVFLETALNPAGYRLLLFLLPPHWAFQEVYAGLLEGAPAWGAAAYAAGYGLFWLGLGALLLRVREWA